MFFGPISPFSLYNPPDLRDPVATASFFGFPSLEPDAMPISSSAGSGQDASAAADTVVPNPDDYLISHDAGLNPYEAQNENDQQAGKAAEAANKLVDAWFNKTMQYNAAEAAKARDFQRELRRTFYPDLLASLRASGINPAFAFANGLAGFSGGSSASASVSSPSSHMQATDMTNVPMEFIKVIASSLGNVISTLGRMLPTTSYLVK